MSIVTDFEYRGITTVTEIIRECSRVGTYHSTPLIQNSTKRIFFQTPHPNLLKASTYWQTDIHLGKGQLTLECATLVSLTSPSLTKAPWRLWKCLLCCVTMATMNFASGERCAVRWSEEMFHLTPSLPIPSCLRLLRLHEEEREARHPLLSPARSPDPGLHPPAGDHARDC